MRPKPKPKAAASRGRTAAFRRLAVAALLACSAACGSAVELGSQAAESGTAGREAQSDIAVSEALPALQEVQQSWEPFAGNYNEPDPRQRADLAGLLAITDAVVVARATTLRPHYSIPLDHSVPDAMHTSSLTLEVETVVAGALVHERQGTVQVTLVVGLLTEPLPPSDFGGHRVVALLRDREAETRGLPEQQPHAARYAGQYGFTSGQGLFVASDQGLVTPLWEFDDVAGAATDSIPALVGSIEAALPADFALPVEQRAASAGPGGG